MDIVVVEAVFFISEQKILYWRLLYQKKQVIMKAIEVLNQYLIHIQHPGQMSAMEWIVTIIIMGIVGGLLTVSVAAAWYFGDPKKTHKVS